MNFAPRSWVGLICRLMLGGVFIYASLDKIAHPAQFAEIIYNYRILPVWAVNVAALVLPWLEIIAGLLLVAGLFDFEAGLIIGVLILIFTAAVGFNLARGLDFQCGCFTTTGEAVGAGLDTLIRDLSLLFLVVVCLFCRLRRDRGWWRRRDRNGVL